MKTILFPTDFTSFSEVFFRMICPIARDQGAEIIVLHVIPPEACPAADLEDQEISRDSAAYQSGFERYLRLQQMASDIPTSFQIKVGRTAATIIKVAREDDCSMIALAGPYHEYLHQQFKGNIPDTVMRTASCPVLCLKESPYQHSSEHLLAVLSREESQVSGPH